MARDGGRDGQEQAAQRHRTLPVLTSPTQGWQGGVCWGWGKAAVSGDPDVPPRHFSLVYGGFVYLGAWATPSETPACCRLCSGITCLCFGSVHMGCRGLSLQTSSCPAVLSLAPRKAAGLMCPRSGPPEPTLGLPRRVSCHQGEVVLAVEPTFRQEHMHPHTHRDTAVCSYKDTQRYVHTLSYMQITHSLTGVHTCTCIHTQTDMQTHSCTRARTHPLANMHPPPRPQ